MPTVSVIVPTLDDRDYLEEALKSILAQSFWDYEVIVVDGGSSDQSLAVIRRYEKRISWFRQSGKGVSRAKNEAIAKARGEYITFLDGDDLWYPEKLEIQVNFLSDHPEYGFCSSDVDFFDEEVIIIKGAISTEKKPRSGYVFDELFTNNFISSATIMLRRECFDRVGNFDEEIFFAEDTDMWLRVAKEFKLGYIPKSLAKYRVHPGARTQQFAKHYASLEKIYGKLNQLYPEYFRQRPTLLRAARFNLYRRWAYRHFEAGEYAASRRLFIKALKYNPRSIFAWKYILSSFLPASLIQAVKAKKNN